MAIKEKNEKTTRSRTRPASLPEGCRGEDGCPSEQNVTQFRPPSLPPSLTYIELGLYTTDFEGQFSVSNNLFGCAVVAES